MVVKIETTGRGYSTRARCCDVKPGYVGVYMRNLLPDNSWGRNVPQFAIMNLNTSNQKAVHSVGWCAK